MYRICTQKTQYSPSIFYNTESHIKYASKFGHNAREKVELKAGRNRYW